LTQTATVFRQKVLPNKWFQAACVFALVLIAYFVTYKATGRAPAICNHYVRLADAFLHGRLYLTGVPDWFEVARIGGKAFVIIPPAPTLFALPLVPIWGLGTDQTLISMTVGAGAIGLFWVAATQLGWSLRFRAAVAFMIALGTNLWWAALDGGGWQLAHISAVFFLMAALVETTAKNRPWLIGLLVGLAGLSRLTTFFAAIFFAYTIVRGVSNRRALVTRLGAFAIGLAVMVALYFAYNYGRYGTISDQGYYHPQIYQALWAKGMFNIGYIPRQIEAILFYAPKLTDGFPYFRPTLYGLGLFFTTPALLYMFSARLKERLTLAALVGLIAVAIPIVTYWSVGWIQFGYRYSLDFLLFMVLLMASGMRYRLSPLKIAVIVLSFAVNLWGVVTVWAT
jgi:hypothetical protein